jgi:murein DD-endopeptidase MepM/ murein hydrolase activator NlpD
MAARRGFNLLVVKSDGSRVVRLSLPRWLLWGAAGLVALTLLSLAAISADYLSLRQQRASLSSLHARLAEQQALLETSQQRMREIRAEIENWRHLHARIWEPFGPELGPAKPGGAAGIGGGTAQRHLAAVEADSTTVREELDRLVGMVREEGDNLRSLERFLGRAAKVLASLPSRWPVRGPVNSDFGKRTSPWGQTPEFHSGIDIGAPIGTPVRAPAPGTVIYAGTHPEYGITIILDHGNDTKSLYGHLSRLHVTANQRVQRGEVIGLTGNTGRSSGPHLHYEILVKGQSVNPTSYIWEDPVPGVRSASR